MSGSGYLKFRNDRGVPEICIGVREFECIGVLWLPKIASGLAEMPRWAILASG
jgi:hypothetical protein